MIKECVQDIGTKVMALLPWVTEWKHLGRQDPSGIVVKLMGEEWIGIDDRNSGRAYVRFRDGLDATFSDARLTSVQDTTTTYRLRAVLMHHCHDEVNIARFFALGIMSAVNHELRYSVRLRSVSSDKQWVIPQEMKTAELKKEGAGVPDDHLQVALVDFDVTLRDSVLVGGACIPDCNAC